MNNELEIINKIKELLEFPEERMWFEFKENWYDPNQLGEYISALETNTSFARNRFSIADNAKFCKRVTSVKRNCLGDFYVTVIT